MIESNYFRAIRQHFEEGLFQKTLSMEQAYALAQIVMSHVPHAQRRPMTLGEDRRGQQPILENKKRPDTEPARFQILDAPTGKGTS